jgi:hypothetical protein
MYRMILIIVGVSVAYNSKTTKNKINLVTGNESVAQKVSLIIESIL